jgi:heme exporter protein D
MVYNEMSGLGFFSWSAVGQALLELKMQMGVNINEMWG